MKLPVDFPGTLSVVCLVEKLGNPNISHSRAMYNQLFTRIGVEGSSRRWRTSTINLGLPVWHSGSTWALGCSSVLLLKLFLETETLHGAPRTHG